MRKKHPHIERSSVNSQVFDQLTSKRSKNRSSLTNDMTNCFKDAVSFFTNLQSEPKSIPLAQWLKVCKHGSRYTEQVIEYRRTGNDELKKSLPLITVGAVCEGGRKMGNVIHRTGWISLDIDGKDNPHIKKAEQLRDEIAKSVYIAFAGLSAGGKGVHCLVKVKHPEKQENHFEQLKRDFEARGIILDKSKGKNPNDARFYSYDPGAIVKSSFKIYDRLPVKKERSSVNPLCFDHLTSSKYGQAALEDELNILSSTSQGERNNQLFKSSAALANLVSGGVLDEHTVKENLIEAARRTGLNDSEINTTLKSGFNAGLSAPRTPDRSLQGKRGISAPKKNDRSSQAKFGHNPWTGEVFDERGYPAAWDEIEFQPGSQQDIESVRATIQDGEPDELQQLMKADPIFKEIVELFDCEIIKN